MVKSLYLSEKSSDFGVFCTKQRIWNSMAVNDEIQIKNGGQPPY